VGEEIFMFYIGKKTDKRFSDNLYDHPGSVVKTSGSANLSA